VALPPPDDEAVEEVLHRLLRQLRATFAELGSRWPEEAEELLCAEAVQQRLPSGETRRRRRRSAGWRGRFCFSLHADTAVHAFDRVGLQRLCGPTETVGECAADVADSASTVGRFAYGAAHFQFHAANVMGLAAMNAGALSDELRSVLGASNDLRYLQTNLAGAANTSAAEYAKFLRKLLRGELVMAGVLGAEKVCGSSACTTAVLSPAPRDETWNYSLGHWVEDDPQLGDHAFSSAGAPGFYPWVDRTKTWYGLIARRADSTGGSQGVLSLRCGRLIRQAMR